MCIVADEDAVGSVAETCIVTNAINLHGVRLECDWQCLEQALPIAVRVVFHGCFDGRNDTDAIRRPRSTVMIVDLGLTLHV